MNVKVVVLMINIIKLINVFNNVLETMHNQNMVIYVIIYVNIILKINLNIVILNVMVIIHIMLMIQDNNVFQIVHLFLINNIFKIWNVYNNVQHNMQNHYKEIYVIICVHIFN